MLAVNKIQGTARLEFQELLDEDEVSKMIETVAFASIRPLPPSEGWNAREGSPAYAAHLEWIRQLKAGASLEVLYDDAWWAALYVDAAGPTGSGEGS